MSEFWFLIGSFVRKKLKKWVTLLGLIFDLYTVLSLFVYLRNIDAVDVLLLVAGVPHDCVVAIREDIGHLQFIDKG